jgi:nicotinamide-nucleotide amidase
MPDVCSPRLLIETLAVGDELLRGETLDSNASYLQAALLRAGLRVARGAIVPDDEDTLASELSRAADRANVVVVSGGLGPTVDDRTAAAAARAFGRTLVCDEASLERMRGLFASRGYPFTPNNEKPAWVPNGARVIENPVGSAPAFVLDTGRAQLYFLPGVPREYRVLADRVVVPEIAALREGVVARALVLHTIGTTESRVDQLLRGVDFGDVRLSTRVDGPETNVILVAEGSTAGAAEDALARAATHAREALGPLVYGEGDATLASTLGEALAARGVTIAVAESCTGGLVSAAITDVPGASRYFSCGVVAYANDAKTAMCDVPPELIKNHGAVSEAVVRALARGIRARCGTDVGVGVTGIAGPTGATDDKPVGLVHFAAIAGVREVHRRVVFPPGRERVRKFAARVALAVALESLRSGDEPSERPHERAGDLARAARMGPPEPSGETP